MILSLFAHMCLDNNTTTVGSKLWHSKLFIELPKFLVARVHFDGPQFELVTLCQLVIKLIQELISNLLILKS